VAGSSPPQFFPARKATVDVSVGEVLYLVLVVAVGWWAYSSLKEYF
jgi:hypothetical protein